MVIFIVVVLMFIFYKFVSEEFKYQDVQGLEVGRDIVVFVEDDFWGYVFWCFIECLCFLVQINFFGEIKINLLENKKI